MLVEVSRDWMVASGGVQFIKDPLKKSRSSKSRQFDTRRFSFLVQYTIGTHPPLNID